MSENERDTSPVTVDVMSCRMESQGDRTEFKVKGQPECQTSETNAWVLGVGVTGNAKVIGQVQSQILECDKDTSPVIVCYGKGIRSCANSAHGQPRRLQQSEFTASRSTIDAILALRLVSELQHEFNQLLNVAYIEIKAAFDPVDHYGKPYAALEYRLNLSI